MTRRVKLVESLASARKHRLSADLDSAEEKRVAGFSALFS
jgi:hypothetical protein